MLDLISNDSGPAHLAITQIRRDGGTQPRQGMDEDAVNDYANALRNGERLPAVDVMFDGGVYWLFDGFHRTEAHLRAGLSEIAVTIHQGSLEDAQWRSFGANKGHGLRRSNADKERAVRAALRHATGAGLSNVQIARHVGVDDKTVARYRAEMESTSEIPRLETRTGADGKERKAPKPPKPPSPDPIALRLPLTQEEIANLIYAALDEKTAGEHEYRAWMEGHREFSDYSPTIPDGRLLLPDSFERVYARILSYAPPSPAPAPTPPSPAGAATVPLSPPVTPTIPADLEGAGWALLRVGGEGNYYCLNRTLSKATATHEEPGGAIAEAYVMQGTPWRDLVTPVTTQASGKFDKERAIALAALYRQAIESLPEFRRMVRASGKVDSVEQFLGDMIRELRQKFQAL